MSVRWDRRPGAIAMLITAVLAGCGGDAPVVEDPVPVSIAEPVSFEDAGLSPRPMPSPTPEAPPEPSPEPSPEPDAATDVAEEPSSPVGPSSADAAAFLASDALAGLHGLEHVVVDLDGDTWKEVVATGVRDRSGVVRVAWWTSEGYEVLAADEAGPGHDVTDLRAADINRDDRIELLVVVEGEGLQSLALWRVLGRGRVERLEAVGGCHDGRNVYGVTTARLQSGGDGPPTIVADCDESPLPVADWSEQRWEWRNGAYRHVTRGSSEEDSGEDGDGDGRGSGGDGDPGDDEPDDD